MRVRIGRVERVLVGERKEEIGREGSWFVGAGVWKLVVDGKLGIRGAISSSLYLSVFSILGRSADHLIGIPRPRSRQSISNRVLPTFCRRSLPRVGSRYHSVGSRSITVFPASR